MKLHKVGFYNAGLALLLVPAILSVSLALQVPPLRGRINDLAGIIPAEKARQLEDRLAQFEKETGHQIAVLTIPSLEGDSLEDFSIRVAETWKIGKKGFDNGAILLVAQNDRKMRIEVGYGLEGVLPDAIASRIIREVIAPRFRTGDYAGGIESGLEAIIKVTQGEALPKSGRAPKPQTPDAAAAIGALVTAALFALIIGISQRTVPRGAVGGGTAAGISSALAASATGPFWIFAIILGAILGGLSSYYAHQSSSRAWTTRGPRRHDYWGSGGWGPTFGGGGSGGGDSGGGGFSGGGGDFGGGGASGDW